MDKAKRKAIIAGNWKMNKTPKEATALLNEIKPLVADADCEVIACVPYVDLAAAIEATAGSNVKIGAENCHWAASGAFTGEISTGMLKEIGVEYVVLGHSERRQYFGETDETVNKRTKAALAAGLKPIVCVGELLWERECNITEEVIARQIKLDCLGYRHRQDRYCRAGGGGLRLYPCPACEALQSGRGRRCHHSVRRLHERRQRRRASLQGQC